MARLKAEVKREKQAQGLRLYLKNITLEEISDMIGVSVNSLRNWKIENNWDDMLKIQNISPAEMRMKVLETMQSMEMGEKPKFKPDDISKLAKAYEQLSDKKKNIGFLMDDFNTFSDFLLAKVTKEETSKKKKDLLEFTKKVRVYMDELLNIKRRELHD